MPHVDVEWMVDVNKKTQNTTFANLIVRKESEKWVAPRRTKEMFTTGWPRKKVGEREAPSNCCKLTKNFAYLKVLLELSTYALHQAAGAKCFPRG